MSCRSHGFILRGFAIALAVAAALLAVASGIAVTENEVASADPSQATPEAPPADRYSVELIGPRKEPGIATGQVDSQGQPVLASCTTCHTTRPANAQIHDGSQLKDFHQGMTTKHGGLQCVACHNADDYSRLRLAGGENLAFKDSMRLCAQCHGPQFRDYEHGAHGGMTGHWDLARGPRRRNHCLACHDAHAPQYQGVMPVFSPRDLHSRDAPVAHHP